MLFLGSPSRRAKTRVCQLAQGADPEGTISRGTHASGPGRKHSQPSPWRCTAAGGKSPGTDPAESVGRARAFLLNSGPRGRKNRPPRNKDSPTRSKKPMSLLFLLPWGDSSLPVRSRVSLSALLSAAAAPGSLATPETHGIIPPARVFRCVDGLLEAAGRRFRCPIGDTEPGHRIVQPPACRRDPPRGGLKRCAAEIAAPRLEKGFRIGPLNSARSRGARQAPRAFHPFPRIPARVSEKAAPGINIPFLA